MSVVWTIVEEMLNLFSRIPECLKTRNIFTITSSNCPNLIFVHIWYWIRKCELNGKTIYFKQRSCGLIFPDCWSNDSCCIKVRQAVEILQVFSSYVWNILINPSIYCSCCLWKRWETLWREIQSLIYYIYCFMYKFVSPKRWQIS